jgi:phage shock protein A
MDELFTTLEQYRRLYFKALKKQDPEASHLKIRIDKLEQKIESQLSDVDIHDINNITQKMNNHVKQALGDIDKVNDTTSILASSIKFLDNILTTIDSLT